MVKDEAKLIKKASKAGPDKKPQSIVAEHGIGMTVARFFNAFAAAIPAGIALMRLDLVSMNKVVSGSLDFLSELG